MCDVAMWIIGVFKPEVEPYRLHEPAIAAMIAFLITASQALPEYIKVSDEV